MCDYVLKLSNSLVDILEIIDNSKDFWNYCFYLYLLVVFTVLILFFNIYAVKFLEEKNEKPDIDFKMAKYDYYWSLVSFVSVVSIGLKMIEKQEVWFYVAYIVILTALFFKVLKSKYSVMVEKDKLDKLSSSNAA
jgi:hypothetical protein